MKFEKRISIGDIIGIVLTIAVFIIGFMIRQEIKTLSIVKENGFDIKIESSASSISNDYLYSVRGSVTSNDGTDLQISLKEKGLVLVPMVKPLESVRRWYVGSQVQINNSNGEFTATVMLGDKEGYGIGEQFEIVLLLVPVDYFTEGDNLINTPQTGYSSRALVIKRVK